MDFSRPDWRVGARGCSVGCRSRLTIERSGISSLHPPTSPPELHREATPAFSGRGPGYGAPVSSATGARGAQPERAGLSAKTLGVLAVLGLVAAFSLSSTLVKRAETPGILVAFWRLLMVSVAWNVVLWCTGRRVTLGRRSPGLASGRLLRPEPRGVLRGRDAQQRRQRRAARLARPVPHRAGRAPGCSTSTSTRARSSSR